MTKHKVQSSDHTHAYFTKLGGASYVQSNRDSIPFAHAHMYIAAATSVHCEDAYHQRAIRRRLEKLLEVPLQQREWQIPREDVHQLE